MNPIEIRVSSEEVSVLLSRAYDAGYMDGIKGLSNEVTCEVAKLRAHRLFDLIRDWAFERRLREIAAAGPIVKEGDTDVN